MRLSKVSHICTRLLIHERCILSIRFGKTDLVGDVRVCPLLCRSLDCKRWIVHLNHLSLHSQLTFFLVSLFVSHHLQILNLCLRGWWQTLLHSCFGRLVQFLEVLLLILILYYVCLTH